ncbi:MAG: Chemotaxis response regulator protein-glutamate methylesterase [Gemmatimonadaceae bacterium]|nr:Chemotaxis response regulator protein-glutamate methylesterase [Gemmatimonadaceae bacterium]
MTGNRVLVVDDSALVRQVVADVIAESGEFVLAGVARDGADALAKVRALEPDIVTLDVAMPGMHGLEVLDRIMRETPRAVVMLSALDDPRGGDLTIRALELGAVDFVHKPSRVDLFDAASLSDRLLNALRVARTIGPPVSACHATSVEPRATRSADAVLESGVPAACVVAIAASTGGPRALAGLLSAIPRTGDTAYLIVQHMPAGFTESLARRLDTVSDLTVREGCDGERLLADHAYVAPGGKQMRVARGSSGLVLSVLDDALRHGMRPAADPLFESVAQACGNRSVGVVLTGMGRDGAEGLRELRLAGGYAIVQDQATSTVWGMPQAALSLAGADDVASLEMIPSCLAAAMERRRWL